MTAGGSAFGSSSVVRWWKTVPGVGHDLVRRQRVHRDVVGVQLGRQAGGEPLERGLAHAVDGAAAAGQARRAASPGAAPRRRRCSGSSPGRARRMPGSDQPGQVERRLDLDVEHQLRNRLRGEVLDPGEVRDGRVADQDVRRAELAAVSATRRSRSSGLDRSAGIATAVPPAARICSTVSPIVPANGDVPGSVVRAATATAAPSAAEPAGDLRPDAAAGAGHDGDLAVQHAHGDHSLRWSAWHSPGAPSR